MDDGLIARVAASAGVTPDAARKAIALVVDFVMREAPESAIEALLAKAPALQAIVASAGPTGGEGMSPTVKGLMGTGAGAKGGGRLVALGGALMALGLDMTQIHAVGEELFEYARDKAGDDVVDAITAAIPGLEPYT